MIVILCNGLENFILEFMHHELLGEQESKQRKIIQLKRNQRIHHVYNA